VLNVLGIVGSLRRESFNGAAMRACLELTPPEMTLEIFDRMHEIPLYNEDERAKGFPSPVAALRTAIASADAVLFATPEYNHSMSGVLKNAIDWVSRPPDVPLVRKSMAIFGASRGVLGSVRAQIHLRNVLGFFDSVVVQKPEVYIGTAHEKVNSDGVLHDQATREFLAQLLIALRDQTMTLNALRLIGSPA
jgi:chromate reductase